MHSEDKGFAADQLNLEWMIEDNPEHLQAVNDYGYKTITFDQPWNQGYEHRYNWRCYDWFDILGLLIDYKEG